MRSRNSGVWIIFTVWFRWSLKWEGKLQITINHLHSSAKYNVQRGNENIETNNFAFFFILLYSNIWFLHCHFAFHLNSLLVVQSFFLSRPLKIDSFEILTWWTWILWSEIFWIPVITFNLQPNNLLSTVIFSVAGIFDSWHAFSTSCRLNLGPKICISSFIQREVPKLRWKIHFSFRLTKTIRNATNRNSHIPAKSRTSSDVCFSRNCYRCWYR